MLLFCFPHAGGSPTRYRDWTSALATEIEVRPISYATLNLAGSSVAQAAAGLVDRILATPGRFALFGHSLGALMAFEVARALASRTSRQPSLLAVSGHVAPHLPSPGPVLHELSGPRFWSEVRQLGGTPEALLDDPQIREVAEPRLRAEFRTAETYRYVRGLPLNCPLLAFAGSDDTRAPVPGVRDWRLHSRAEFTLSVLPGGHFFLDDPENAERIHESLRSELAPTARTADELRR